MVSLTSEVKTRTLIEALPYLRAHHGATTVVKVGGEVLLDPARATALAHDIGLLCLVGVRVVVVHGGGPQVSDAMRASGTTPSFVDGLRVTDDACMEVVRSVLLGEINPGLVSALTRAGVSAVGIAGFSGNLMQAERIPGLGRVGSVTRCDTELIGSLLDAGATPVVAPVCSDPAGGFLNINADSVAASLAAALGAQKLVYMTNVEGLYATFGDTDSLLSELRAADLESLLGTLSEGMRPKAEGTLTALRAGVGRVHVLDGRVEHALLLELFTREGAGTVVLP